MYIKALCIFRTIKILINVNVTDTFPEAKEFISHLRRQDLPPIYNEKCVCERPLPNISQPSDEYDSDSEMSQSSFNISSQSNENSSASSECMLIPQNNDNSYLNTDTDRSRVDESETPNASRSIENSLGSQFNVSRQSRDTDTGRSGANENITNSASQMDENSFDSQSIDNLVENRVTIDGNVNLNTFDMNSSEETQSNPIQHIQMVQNNSFSNESGDNSIDPLAVYDENVKHEGSVHFPTRILR